jgi:Zn-dependent M32 family carboxypeptidase
MWLINIDVIYLSEEWTESFNNEKEAEERYEELLKIYKDGISNNTVEIYFAEVKKSSVKK